jgi:hypothetical protein
MTTDEFIWERTKERDRFELDLSDSFDVKASFVLLILTFLGTISATILTADHLTTTPKLAQIPVIVCVVISGIFCVACLWPKEYLLDDLPEKYSEWVASLGEPEADQLVSITDLSLSLAHERIRRNHSLNTTKTWYLNRAFWSMSAGLFAELSAVAYVAFATHPS